MGYSKEHTEKTRERILDSAAALFRSRGFEAASMQHMLEKQTFGGQPDFIISGNNAVSGT